METRRNAVSSPVRASGRPSCYRRGAKLPKLRLLHQWRLLRTVGVGGRHRKLCLHWVRSNYQVVCSQFGRGMAVIQLISDKTLEDTSLLVSFAATAWIDRGS